MGNFKEVTSLDAENTIKVGGIDKKTGKKNPTSAEGYYLGNRQVTSKMSKSGFATLHFLQTPKGNLGVWGKTDMDRKLASVPAGTMVRITFTGTRPSGKGNDMLVFKVELDETNTIEVTAASTGDGAENTEGGYDTGADEDSTTDDVTSDYEAEEATQSAALAASERRSKVEALLNKGKAKTATRN